MPDSTLAIQFDTELSHFEQDLRAAVLRIIGEHANRGFSSLQGPTIGRIIEACDQTIEQAYDAAQRLLQENLDQQDAGERAQRVLAFLPQVERRLTRLAMTPARLHRFAGRCYAARVGITRASVFEPVDANSGGAAMKSTAAPYIRGVMRSKLLIIKDITPVRNSTHQPHSHGLATL